MSLSSASSTIIAAVTGKKPSATIASVTKMTTRIVSVIR